MGILYEFFILPFVELYKYRELILYQLRAELKQKHFEKALGPLWWFGEPFFMAITMIILTEFLFKRTFAEHGFAIIIMSVLVWRWFSRSMDGSPNLLLSFRTELSSTNFPILPLIYTNLLVEMLFFAFGLAVIFAVTAASGVHFTINLVYLPIVVILQLIMITGFVTIIGKVGLFYRDISQIVSPIVGIWFYLSPGIYPENLIPDAYRWLYDLNPFATIFPAWRNVIIDGTAPDLYRLGIWFIIFIPIMLLGLRNIVKDRGEYYRRL